MIFSSLPFRVSQRNISFMRKQKLYHINMAVNTCCHQWRSMIRNFCTYYSSLITTNFEIFRELSHFSKYCSLIKTIHPNVTVKHSRVRFQCTCHALRNLYHLHNLKNVENTLGGVLQTSHIYLHKFREVLSSVSIINKPFVNNE